MNRIAMCCVSMTTCLCKLANNRRVPKSVVLEGRLSTCFIRAYSRIEYRYNTRTSSRAHGPCAVPRRLHPVCLRPCASSLRYYTKRPVAQDLGFSFPCHRFPFLAFRTNMFHLFCVLERLHAEPVRNLTVSACRLSERKQCSISSSVDPRLCASTTDCMRSTNLRLPSLRACTHPSFERSRDEHAGEQDRVSR